MHLLFPPYNNTPFEQDFADRADCVTAQPAGAAKSSFFSGGLGLPPGARIALIANSAWNLWHFRGTLIRLLARHGHEVVCIAPDDGYADRLAALGPGVRYVALRHFSRSSLSPWSNLRTLHELTAVLRHERPRCAVFYTIKPNIFGALAARLTGVPAVATVEGLGYAGTAPGPLRWLAFRLYRLALRSVRRVVFLNADDSDAFVRAGAVQPERLRIIKGTGVDTEYFQPGFSPQSAAFSPQSASRPGAHRPSGLQATEPGTAQSSVHSLQSPVGSRQHLGPEGSSPSYYQARSRLPTADLGLKTEDCPTFLFIGRLLGDKGVREFVAAARRLRSVLPDARFQILGRCDPGNPASVDPDEVADWIADGAVDYLGYADDVRPFIARADAIVLPSYREGMPRAILEGLAMAKPIISTTSTGCRETVEHGANGFLVPAADAESLGAAMLRFAGLPAGHRRAMGQFGRQKALREFSDAVVLPQYVAVLRECV